MNYDLAMSQIQRTRRSLLTACIFFLLSIASHGQQATESRALRVFIRAGAKTHGPGQHDHPRFLAEWTELLNDRGAAARGSLEFPTREELAQTDVLVMYAAEAATIEGDERARFESFQEAGGGLVVIHDAVCGSDSQWFKTRAGGAWEHGHSKWLEGEIGLYFSDPHPITRGIPHFDLDDEIYYDLHLDPTARVLANSFHDVFSITPQMWVVDEPQQRVFVSLQGHQHSSFSHPAYRALLLRGIAWAGKREVDLFNHPEELAALRYPPGGPTAPERAAEQLVLNEDFELQLVAHEPLVVNPISLDWDAKGRPWVAQTPGYPYKQQSSGIPAHDQITILRDDDGDGLMDSSTVFADGLDLVTSFVFHQDGIIVSQAPEILWLRDTDGDDRADERVVLFEGFGFGDTHATISNMRWGLDGWIYGTQGYSGNASRSIRSPHFDGGQRDFGHVPNGVFRFLPDGSAIEAHSAFGSNTWGLDFTPAGELFFTMANGSHLRHVLLSEDALGPHRLENTRTWRDIVDHREVQRLSTADRAPYVQIDFVGGFTAASGCTLYSGGAWPGEFEGNHFVCEPTVNLVHRDLVTPDGLSFQASKPRREEFLASTDPWFRPVQTRVGPDGALYVLDFYNQAAVHNDTRGPDHGPTNAAVRPDRDRHHGRIWRVQHREAPSSLPRGANFARSMTELRHLIDGGQGTPPAIDAADPAERVRALWFAYLTSKPDHQLARRVLGDRDAGVRRNAALMSGELFRRDQTQGVQFPLMVRAIDKDPRVQLAAISALRHFPLGEMEAQTLVPYYSLLEHDETRSAFVRTAQANVPLFLRVSLETRAGTSDEGELAAFDDLLERLVAIEGRSKEAARVVSTLGTLAAADASIAPVLPKLLTRLQRETPDGLDLASHAKAAGQAIAQLFEAHGSDGAIGNALLPLAARLGESPELQPAIDGMSQALLAGLMDPDASVALRHQALETLLELPSQRQAAIRASSALLDAYFQPEEQRRVIQALASVSEVQAAVVLAAAFPRVGVDARDLIFDKLTSRATWSQALLDALESGDIDRAELGPRRLFRLNEHPDQKVAERARALLQREGADSQAMDDLIASLLPSLQEPGDRDSGRELFIQNCAVCHRYEDLPDGVGADVGPALTGMGAHGAEHLLPFIVDPNRSVEAAYLEYVAETLDGELVAGVLTYDGPASITLSSSAGAKSVPRDELQSLRSTGRSPMPTGFESLGADGLRDILSFLCDDYRDYRVLSLDHHVNASTSLGLYDRRHDAKPMRFREFGVLDVFGHPMEVLDPDLVPRGDNAIVLKGGARDDWQSKTDRPQRVEIPVGFALQRVHVLGGISAWGHPFFGEQEPAVTWTFHYADGSSESRVLRDGVEFADWIRRHDVPGSRYVEGLLEDGGWGQVRHFSVDPSKPESVIDSISLESFDNRTAPTFLALTAQLRGATPRESNRAAPKEAPDFLIFGGGSSHDWQAHFAGSLRETLIASELRPAQRIAYSSSAQRLMQCLPELEFLILANNRSMTEAGLREALYAHVQADKALLLMHAATWYNWPDWPEYNRDLVGGGSRGHESYGAFEVRLEAPEHPALEGLPERFEITDELYRFELDQQGPGIEVLARGISKTSGQSYPVLWQLESESKRLFVTTLGHDGGAHDHPAFQRFVQNIAKLATEAR